MRARKPWATAAAAVLRYARAFEGPPAARRALYALAQELSDEVLDPVPPFGVQSSVFGSVAGVGEEMAFLGWVGVTVHVELPEVVPSVLVERFPRRRVEPRRLLQSAEVAPQGHLGTRLLEALSQGRPTQRHEEHQVSLRFAEEIGTDLGRDRDAHHQHGGQRDACGPGHATPPTK